MRLQSASHMVDREGANPMYILVVEDDARIANLVERALRGAGHRVDVVHDGAEGLTRTELGGYELIVLDVMLPGMEGFEVARALRGSRGRIPVQMSKHHAPA